MNSPMLRGLVWSGTRTDRFDELVVFYRTGLSLELVEERHHFAAFRLDDGSIVEVFGPSDVDHLHFSHAPVIGFQVDDIDAARTRIESNGGVFLAPTESDGRGTAWAHFTGPDGNIYEITCLAGDR